MNENIEKLSDKDFIKMLSIQNSLAKTLRHRYSVEYTTAQDKLLEVYSEKKAHYNGLFLEGNIQKLKNDFMDEVRKKLNIIRVTLKNKDTWKYKLNITIQALQNVGKYDILNICSEKIVEILSIEYVKIRQVEQDNKNKTFYEIEVSGKPSSLFQDEELLYMEIEKLLNTLEYIKVVSIGINVNKRARVYIDNLLEFVDFSDDFIDVDTKKEVFYKNIDSFELTENEHSFVNLVFKGYNPYSENDILVFLEAIKGRNPNEKPSKKYIKGSFFDRLCNKLSSNSPFIG